MYQSTGGMDVAWNRQPSTVHKKQYGSVDIILFLFVVALLYAVIQLGVQITAPYSLNQSHRISLNPMQLPIDALWSLFRMFAAYFASLIFSIVYGYVAAYSPFWRRILVPLLDILQSVPVLGFLSATIALFVALFPSSSVGLELASIFAIFTAQAWNMTFSFYHSIVNIPRDLRESAKIYHLSAWERLLRLELPAAAISLVWNSMMSFGGSWFFLAASEAITVFHHNIRLPGLGSYLAEAMTQGNTGAIWADLVTMMVVIVLVDQLFWRPLVAWTQRFKLELTPDTVESTSWVLMFLRRSVLREWFVDVLWQPLMEKVTSLGQNQKKVSVKTNQRQNVLLYATLGLFFFFLAYRFVLVIPFFIQAFSLPLFVNIFLMGLATAGRVLVAIILGALWTVPVGVYIGFHPRLTRVAQPIVQLLASFPANMLFPFVTVLYLAWHVNFQWGAIPLMMLGTQWYILFNVIAGAQSIPADLKEAATVFGIKRLVLWKNVILPGIFPSLVTGGITAAGGAWNASIVAEWVSWGPYHLVAYGLGAYITQTTQAGQWANLAMAISVMSLLVVLFNRLVWRRLYALSENKFRLD